MSTVIKMLGRKRKEVEDFVANQMGEGGISWKYEQRVQNAKRCVEQRNLYEITQKHNAK